MINISAHCIRFWFVSYRFRLQGYESKSERFAGSGRSTWQCPYRRKCACRVALAVKSYPDRWELLHSGQHQRNSHTKSKGILSPLQRNAVITSVKHSPMTARGSVVCNLDSLSPGKRVPFDKRSTRAVGRLVDSTRRQLLAKSIPVGIELDGSEGAMIQLAGSMSLSRLIARHNDVHDRFHLDEHQPICLGYQFTKNVRHFCLSTASLLTNGARAVNSKWQVYLHNDGAYNWCKKDIGLLAYGLNSMGNLVRIKP